MGEIPWRKIAAAVRRKDARWLRALAQATRSDGRHKMLLLFADIVDSKPAANGHTRNGNHLQSRAKAAYEMSRDSLVSAARMRARGNSRHRNGEARIA